MVCTVFGHFHPPSTPPSLPSLTTDTKFELFCIELAKIVAIAHYALTYILTEEATNSTPLKHN